MFIILQSMAEADDNEFTRPKINGKWVFNWETTYTDNDKEL